MKKTRQDEDVEKSTYSFFGCMPFAVRSGTFVTALEPSTSSTEVLDRFMATIKWVFLYVPGVAGIHFIMMGLVLSLFYVEWPPEIGVGILGSVGFCTFMIMLGIGKVTDLKYLRVAVSIIATSGLLALLHAILAILFHSNFFGLYIQISGLFTLFIGYLVKRDTDKIRLAAAEQNGG